MPPRRALSAAHAAALLALLAAGPALAQAKPKPRPIPQARAAADLTLTAPKPASPAPPPPIALRLSGLKGMTPVGDPAPACRAQCSKDRYVCHAGGDPTDCDSRWIPCLHACSAR